MALLGLLPGSGGRRSSFAEGDVETFGCPELSWEIAREHQAQYYCTNLTLYALGSTKDNILET